MMEIGTGRSWTAIEWRFIGEDLFVTLVGGERPHIGAAALACLENGEPVVRLLLVPKHREKELARFCAERVCRAARRTVLVSCGIHIDRASRSEIELLCANAETLVRRLAERLGQEGGPAEA